METVVLLVAQVKFYVEVSSTNITPFSVHSSSLLGSQNVFHVELVPDSFFPSLLIDLLDVTKL